MNHCLVTGGAGFIGSHLCEALLERGDRLTIVDNLSLGKKNFFVQNNKPPEGCVNRVGFIGRKGFAKGF